MVSHPSAPSIGLLSRWLAPSSHMMIMLDTEQSDCRPKDKSLTNAPDQPQDAQNLQTFREIRPDSPNSVPSVPPRAPTRSSKEEDRVRREHSRLKKKIETANSQTIAIMTQLENARKQESAFRNEVQALEARLEEANMEKVDALEAAFTYEGEIKRLQQKHKTLFQDKELRVEAVHAQSQDFARKLESAESEINKLTAQLKTANERRPEEDAISAFVRQIEDLQSKLTTSKSDRHRLKKENEHFRLELDDAEQRLKEVMKVNEKLVREGTQGGEYGRVRRENLELKAKCSKYEESIAKIQLNSEEYYRLLKSEIKRKACKRQQCLEDGHLDPLLYPLANTDLSPRDKERLLSKEMKETKSKAARLLGLSEDSQDPQTQLRILEKENDYHVRDIVAYRVVVRDYEREAKKLAARIQKRDTMLLQLQQHKQTHPSPSRDTPQSSVSSASTGPGYSPRTPQFPPGTPSTAMSTPLSSISMGRTERAASAPQGSGQVPKLGSRSSFSIHKKLPKPPPLTSPSEDSPKNPRGLGITSHPYSGPPPSPSPRSVPRIGNSPMQSLTPIREVSLKMRKSRRTMSESVVTAYPRTPPNGTGRESDASPEKTERSSSNESVPRPSLPELAGNSAIPASQDATITSPDTTSAAHDTEREREMWKSRKAAVRANVLARAEGRTDASERSDGSPMGRVLRLKRSKKDLGGSVEEGKRSPGFWRGDGIKGHSRTRSEA
ncbi:hypothetical protein EJ05DRAFT_381298 [Pseudovirgaria hyperparasitica]|uniref:Uncharacterized protein n=1 Tax=Pseudovirgaria hyperparasitica TaxID=470096 RepID=A0A6A6W6I0_9PEZI|nr:uncharacterized protein EJ05DRAFT_381298 [Pseudovirgaria hyperparasitica]KAF2758223.1 hypothetical protein EJ05DRAFT_381298 [Pseudovirgaria hyperparasitica]